MNLHIYSIVSATVFTKVFPYLQSVSGGSRLSAEVSVRTIFLRGIQIVSRLITDMWNGCGTCAIV